MPRTCCGWIKSISADNVVWKRACERVRVHHRGELWWLDLSSRTPVLCTPIWFLMVLHGYKDSFSYNTFTAPWHVTGSSIKLILTIFIRLSEIWPTKWWITFFSRVHVYHTCTSKKFEKAPVCMRVCELGEVCAAFRGYRTDFLRLTALENIVLTAPFPRTFIWLNKDSILLLFRTAILPSGTHPKVLASCSLWNKNLQTAVNPHLPALHADSH